jgi:hypothetical protein|tara:strand:+ start:273 stop:488 length:216 start_codon:yes stop_codon:yes gene_type:complete
MARRKAGNTHTTISVTWSDKEIFRKYAKKVKETRTGEMFESDAVVFHKILEEYISNNTSQSEGHSTYPSKT